jgi:hypothetical protein
MSIKVEGKEKIRKIVDQNQEGFKNSFPHLSDLPRRR